MNDSNGFDPNSAELFTDPPTWPKVVGILSIVFGGLSLFCGSAALAMVPFSKGMIEPQLNGDPMPPSMELTAADMAVAALSLSLNLLLVIAGAGLLNRKAVSRILHFAYAFLFLPVVVGSVLMQFQKQGAMEQWAADYPDNPIAKSVQQQQDLPVPMPLIQALATLIISLAWPCFLVIWFGLFKTKHHHMTGEAPPADPFEH